MPKKILIILGHPKRESFCGALARSYIVGAKEAKAEIKELNLGDLKFNPLIKKDKQKLEPDLVTAQKYIKWAEHIVIVYPTWWGSTPALLKGFIDRTFTPGFAFNYKAGLAWEKLLKGKSARIICTMDTPNWYYKLFLKSPGNNMLKKSVLNFSGISPVSITNIGPIKKSTKEERDCWIVNIIKLGQRLK